MEHIGTAIRSDLVDLSITATNKKVVIAHKSHSISIGRKLSILDIANLVLDKRLALARLDIKNKIIRKVSVAVLLGIVGSGQDLLSVTADPVLVQVLGELISRDKLGRLLGNNVL